MFKRLGILIIISMFTCFQYALASKSCPSVGQLKSVKFIQAYYANGMWVLDSSTFSHEENTWNVRFATVMLNAETTEQALKEGQAYYDSAPILIEHPQPKIGADGQLDCNYVPLGEKYFIYSQTPPFHW